MTAVACKFFDACVMLEGTQSYLRYENTTQFVRNFFGTLCTHLSKTTLKTTAYHQRTNGQLNCYNKTIVTRLRHYIATHKCNRDLFVEILTYAYKTQAHLTTHTTFFSSIIKQHPPRPTMFDSPSAFSTYAYHKTHPYFLQKQLLSSIKDCQKCINNLSFSSVNYKTGLQFEDLDNHHVYSWPNGLY